ncbi:MAG: hypothetical protein O9266_12520 [Porphyrobacter sp.]|jgi:hypothetical protein|nr:hypothetical protein [Porphyrobacter sp.]
MSLFRLFLALCLTAITLYTAVTVSQHGFDLLPVFFGDMAKMGWPGQFNLDFMCFLALSAIWVAWRHGFSAGGLGLGLLAFFGGMLFLSLYLLVQTSRTRGDVAALLLGPERAARR